MRALRHGFFVLSQWSQERARFLWARSVWIIKWGVLGRTREICGRAPLCQTHQGYLWDPIKFEERFLRIVSHSWQIARAPLIPSSGEAQTDKTILSLRNSPSSQVNPAVYVSFEKQNQEISLTPSNLRKFFLESSHIPGTLPHFENHLCKDYASRRKNLASEKTHPIVQTRSLNYPDAMKGIMRIQSNPKKYFLGLH